MNFLSKLIIIVIISLIAAVTLIFIELNDLKCIQDKLNIPLDLFQINNSINNFYKGFKYRNIGNYKELREYQNKVIDYNGRINDPKKNIYFETKIIDKFVDIAENHCTINDKRSYDLYIAKTMILFTIATTLLNYIILIFKNSLL